MVGKRLTISTLNTLGIPGTNLIQRYKKIGEFFNKSQTDIVQLQEIFSYWHLHLIKRNMSNFPYCVYKKGFLGPKGGLVTLSRLPLKIIGFSDYKSSLISSRTLVDMRIFKGCLITKLLNYDRILINTHLNSNPAWNFKNGNIYDKLLTSQIKQFHEVVSNSKKKVSLIIAAGDFNIDKSSIYYKKLTNYPRLTDLFKTHNTPTHPKGFITILDKGNTRIDYIFLIGNNTRNLKIKTRQLLTDKINLKNGLFDYVSDHICLQTTIST